jgi:predicted permease
MRRMRALFVRLSGLFVRQRREREMAAEIESHFELHIADNLRAGMTPEDARRKALLGFGGIDKIKEEYRDRSGIPVLETALRDVRYAMRVLRRSPGFTATAVLSLALGIGANTAIFSVIDALILKQLPVRKPEELVMLRGTFQGINFSTSYRAYENFRDSTPFFSAISAVSNVDRYNVTIQSRGSAEPELVRVGVATGNYFSTLGVQARIGRTFTAEDDGAPGAHPVAVISSGYWGRKFGRVWDVAGMILALNGIKYTIIGVTPEGFSGEWVGRPTDFWVPMAMMPQVMIDWTPAIVRDPNVEVLARLRPGVGFAPVRAAATAIFQRLRREDAGPTASRQQLGFIAQTGIEVEPAATGFSPQRQIFAQPLVILMVVVGVVLLIACANLANLLLARSAARQREMAVRLAIGAGASRIVRQLLTESVLLATMGGALGLCFARWGASALAAFARSGPVRNSQGALSLDLRLDARALAFTMAVCLLTAVLFGLAPALRAAHTSISPSLSARSAGSGQPGRGSSLGKLLVVGQVALSLLLLVGGGLFVRTLRNLKSQDLGFDAKHLLLVWISPGATGRQGAAAVSLYQAIEDRVSALPGVRSVSPSVYGLLQGNSDPGAFVTIPGYPPRSDADRRAGWSIVGLKYFESLGLRLLAGRNFTERDTAAAPAVAVIDESMARHFFGQENPIGKRFESWGVTKEVVGVVTDATYESPRERRLMFYLPYRQQLSRLSQTICLAVRTEGNPNGLPPAIRQELQTLDPNLPVIRTETIEEQLNDLLVAERLMATLSAVFGGLGLLLACLGLYGVMAYTAARRTHEMGIRLALGATRAEVLRLVLRESLLMVATGVAIGLVATLAVTRLISAKLFGISPNDPVTVVGAALMMLGVAVLAGFLPARRASRVDPMVALRYE